MSGSATMCSPISSRSPFGAPFRADRAFRLIEDTRFRAAVFMVCNMRRCLRDTQGRFELSIRLRSMMAIANGGHYRFFGRQSGAADRREPACVHHQHAVGDMQDLGQRRKSTATATHPPGRDDRCTRGPPTSMPRVAHPGSPCRIASHLAHHLC